MAKPSIQTYSRYSRDAARSLALMIHPARHHGAFRDVKSPALAPAYQMCPQNRTGEGEPF